MTDHVDDSISSALPHLDDARYDDSLPQPTEPAKPAPAPDIPCYKKERDAWTDLLVRKNAASPYGLEVMRERCEDGLASQEEYEATKFFWGDPADHIERITDPDEAVKVALFFRDRGYIDDSQFRAMGRGIAEREVRRHIEESTAQREQELKDREAEDARAREQALQDAREAQIWEAYDAAHRELSPPK